MNFINELRRRNVFRMAGLYLVSAWLLVQVAATLLPVFDAPTWIMKSLVAFLALGFIVALVVSWIYELTSEGLTRDDDVTVEPANHPEPERRVLRRHSNSAALEGSVPANVRRLNLAFAALILLALGYFVIDKFLRTPSLPQVQSNAVAAADVAAIVDASQSASKLIAIVPFRNRSTLPEDAYFAEGMHDDLLTQLSKIKSLRVISRTSMLRYDDTKMSATEIARKLNAAVVLEGAVQRAGDEVLITVQLIDGNSDVNLWAERYNRAFTTRTVFTIQAEIAQAVADTMRVVLSPAQTKALVTGSTENILAYEAFLQGKLLAANDRATPERFTAALVQFERAITLDPSFSEAFARKARTELASFWFAYADVSMRDAAKRTIDKAVALAPDDVETWMAQAYWYYWGELDYARAEALLKKVIKRVPGHAEAWYARGLVARRDGRFADTLMAFRRSLVLDPANTDTLIELSNTLATLGDRKEADAVRARVVALGVQMPSHAAEDAVSRGDIAAGWAAITGPNDFYSTLPFRIALASRKPDWIAKALSTELWPERLRHFPNYPYAHALAEAEGMLVLGQREAAMVSLRALKVLINASENPYPGGWSSTSSYFYFPCDLPGMLGDLDGVRAAEKDWVSNAVRDAWAESGVRIALAVAFARAGDAEHALDHLDEITSLIGPVSYLDFSNSPGLDSLRQHPRYLALKAAHQRWVRNREASAETLSASADPEL